MVYNRWLSSTPLILPVLSLTLMEKKRFGPKLKMEGLPKASKAKVNFLSLPQEIQTPFDTGYGKDKNSKWEMEIELLEHPNQEVLGKMVWQTTAQVIRIEIMHLPQTKEILKELKECEWHITCDANGQIALEEV